MQLRPEQYNIERKAKPKSKKPKYSSFQFLAPRFRQRQHHHRAREQKKRSYAERAPHAVTIRECPNEPRSGGARRPPDVVDHAERGGADALREQLRDHCAKQPEIS